MFRDEVFNALDTIIFFSWKFACINAILLCKCSKNIIENNDNDNDYLNARMIRIVQ